MNELNYEYIYKLNRFFAMIIIIFLRNFSERNHHPSVFDILSFNTMHPFISTFFRNQIHLGSIIPMSSNTQYSVECSLKPWGSNFVHG